MVESLPSRILELWILVFAGDRENEWDKLLELVAPS
jgi:hypothetical protein